MCGIVASTVSPWSSLAMTLQPAESLQAANGLLQDLLDRHRSQNSSKQAQQCKQCAVLYVYCVSALRPCEAPQAGFRRFEVFTLMCSAAVTQHAKHDVGNMLHSC